MELRPDTKLYLRQDEITRWRESGCKSDLRAIDADGNVVLIKSGHLPEAEREESCRRMNELIDETIASEGWEDLKEYPT